MVVHKGRIHERGPYILVEWLCGANKINKSLRTLIFGQMVVCKKIINVRGPYILVKRSSVNKKNKLMKTQIFDQMIVH